MQIELLNNQENDNVVIKQVVYVIYSVSTFCVKTSAWSRSQCFSNGLNSR